MSLRPAISPSVWRNPAASSKSWPGVRMVTETLVASCPGPPTRISIGSSVANRSGRSAADPSRTASTRTAPTFRRNRASGRIMSTIIDRVGTATLPGR
jgi:hypothetical protein